MGLQDLNVTKGPRAYKIKRDKVPVIPFLSLSPGGRARRREGKKGRLGELRVAEDTKRRSGAPPGGSGRWMETAAPEVELEDEVAAFPPASSSSAASPLR